MGAAYHTFKCLVKGFGQLFFGLFSTGLLAVLLWYTKRVHSAFKPREKRKTKPMRLAHVGRPAPVSLPNYQNKGLAFFLSVLACAFLGAFAAPSRAQTPPLEKWKVSSPPRAGSAEMETYIQNYRAAYQVFLKNGRVAVRPYNEQTPAKITLPFRLALWHIAKEPHAAAKNAPGSALFPAKNAVKVSDGWLLWVNHGEWGGRVEWFSPDGTRHYKISNDQIVAYAKTPQGLFAVQGLAHMSIRQGTLLKLDQNAEGVWQAQTVLDLKDAPYALWADNGAFLVVTSRQLVRVSPSETPGKAAAALVPQGFWDYLYPNSLVAAPNGDLFIGMRGGVARLTKSNSAKSGAYEMRWLTPPPAGKGK